MLLAWGPFCLLNSVSAESYLSRKVTSLDCHMTMDEVRDEATFYWGVQARAALTTSVAWSSMVPTVLLLDIEDFVCVSLCKVLLIEHL